MNNEQPRDLIATLETVREMFYIMWPRSRHTALMRHFQQHIDQLTKERSEEVAPWPTPTI